LWTSPQADSPTPPLLRLSPLRLFFRLVSAFSLCIPTFSRFPSSLVQFLQTPDPPLFNSTPRIPGLQPYGFSYFFTLPPRKTVSFFPSPLVFFLPYSEPFAAFRKIWEPEDCLGCPWVRERTRTGFFFFLFFSWLCRFPLL